MSSPSRGMNDPPRKLRARAKREAGAADLHDDAGPSGSAPRQTSARRRARATPGDAAAAAAAPSQRQGPAADARAAVDEEDADNDEPVVIGGDGPPDEASELRWIRRKHEEILEQTRAAREDITTTLSDMEEERLVREVMRYMIFRQGEKPDVPVPRGDLPIAGHRLAHGAKGTRVIRLAQGKLAETMGFEMEELTQSGASADSKFYVLRSLVPASMRTAHVLPPERAADRGFEMMVLAMVTMNGETMREDELWSNLEEVGIERSSGGSRGGRAEDKLKHMVTKRYLALRKGPPPDKANIYGIGVNASSEIGTERLAAFVRETFAEPAN